MWLWRKAVFVGAGLLCLAALAMPPTFASARVARPAGPARVLFVGNSYTRYNLLPRLVGRMARSVGHPMKVHSVAKGGLTMRMHWLRREALQEIRRGRHTHVVLQGHSLDPIDRTREFATYAGRFHEAIVAAGARPVLYETWARRPGDRLYREHGSLRSHAQMRREVSSVYDELSQQLHAPLAPVGRAFERALQDHPELTLYRSDGTHPTWLGTYLAASVLVGAITGADPRAISYAPWDMPQGKAQALREMAADCLDEAAPTQQQETSQEQEPPAP